MKKTLVALAALSAISAFAQSTVTLTGSVNYGEHFSTDKSSSVGGLKGDRNHLTFAAVEDLGTGYKAGVTLQTRFNSATGQPGYASTAGAPGDAAGTTLFEQTKITLDGGSIGKVDMGRFTNFLGTSPLYLLEDARQSTNAAQAVHGRYSGQIQYTSPAFYGVTVSALNAKATSNCYIAASGGGYAGGALYNYCNAATTDFQAYNVAYNNGPVYVQLSQSQDFLGVKAQTTGATYDAGFAKFAVSQYNQKSDINWNGNTVSTAGVSVGATALTAPSATNNGMKAHKSTEIAAKVPFGRFTGIIGHQTNNTDLDMNKSDGTTKMTKTGWAVLYDITKRTQLQYYGSQVKNGTNATGTTNVSNSWLANGHTTFVGVQHTF